MPSLTLARWSGADFGAGAGMRDGIESDIHHADIQRASWPEISSPPSATSMTSASLCCAQLLHFERRERSFVFLLTPPSRVPIAMTLRAYDTTLRHGRRLPASSPALPYRPVKYLVVRCHATGISRRSTSPEGGAITYHACRFARRLVLRHAYMRVLASWHDFFEDFALLRGPGILGATSVIDMRAESQ